MKDGKPFFRSNKPVILAFHREKKKNNFTKIENYDFRFQMKETQLMHTSAT